ncbi:MAG: hypothetical protein J6C96_07335 [Oscillospiraceae bacterium]|nr:hypothetical protein [Oscillospiraceae bacterium]
MTIVFSSENKIFSYDTGENALTEIPCERITKYRDTVRSIQQRKEWKTSGSGANFMGMTADMIDADELPVQISGLAVCKGQLVYGVNLENVGSVYHRSFDPSDGCEGLVRASNNIAFGTFDCKGDELAISMGDSLHSLHIAVMDISGKYTEYTDGDTIEENPAWSAQKNGIYFSTAGYARNQNGVIAATSPRSIAYLDLDRSSMTEILSDEKYDYLHVKEDKGGTLYYIRQPYGGEKPRNDITFKDILLFPYRIIKGLFGFLNFFSTIFGGESLKSGGASANGVKSKQRSQQDIIIEGNIINAEKLDKINEASGDKLAGIMPQSRVLIKRTADGSEEIIKKGVLDYALADSGEVIISNGRHIIKIAPNGSEEHITKAKLAMNIALMK